MCLLVDILTPKPYPPTLRYSLLRSCYRRRHCVCVLVDILTQNHILRRWDTACCDPRPCRVWSRVDGAEAEPAVSELPQCGLPLLPMCAAFAANRPSREAAAWPRYFYLHRFKRQSLSTPCLLYLLKVIELCSTCSVCSVFYLQCACPTAVCLPFHSPARPCKCDQMRQRRKALIYLDRAAQLRWTSRARCNHAGPVLLYHVLLQWQLAECRCENMEDNICPILPLVCRQRSCRTVWVTGYARSSGH